MEVSSNFLYHRLGTDYRTHSPHFYDKAMSRLWFAGGSAVDEASSSITVQPKDTPCL